MSTTTDRRYDITDIRTANRMQGGHFFDADALRFFRSRIGDTVYHGPGGVYFVTSEQFVSSRGERATRAYTVRRFDPETGSVETAGPFNTLTRAAAHRRAVRLASGHED